MHLALSSPLPVTWIPLLWRWLCEEPRLNFTDASPTTLVAFTVEMRRRQTQERSWGVAVNDKPVGAIAYLPYSAWSGTFHGICFTRSACGTGIARAAVERVLDELEASGVHHVEATFFADNERVAQFLRSLGAVPMSGFSGRFRRGGVSMRLSRVVVSLVAQQQRKAG